MTVKINKLEIENVKRVKAVQLEPTATGLTIIGGNNNQGKTSVLDAIAWSLGGDRYKPSTAYREGSVVPPYSHLELSNGLIVERKGKNGDLKVIDPSGNKAGQNLLNEFVEQFALDLPKFMQSNNKEKAQLLLKIIGVGETLYALEQQEKEIYNQRTTTGQIADQKKKYAAEMLVYPEAPKELISATELIMKQQEILTRNGENQRKRQHKAEYERIITNLTLQLNDLQEKLAEAQNNLEIANQDALNLQDESTAELENSIANIEEINRKVRTNMDKEKAEMESSEYIAKYDDQTIKLNEVRTKKIELLKNATLPLEELSVEDGELMYKGFKWDNLSGSEQLKVATAIVRKLNPNCGFVLIDKLEQMDLITLNEFGRWLESEGLQVIATRVSSGEECSIIIEDGYSSVPQDDKELTQPSWKEGEF